MPRWIRMKYQLHTILKHNQTILVTRPNDIPSVYMVIYVPTAGQAADTTAELVKPNSPPVALPKNAPGHGALHGDTRNGNDIHSLLKPWSLYLIVK